MRMCNEHWSGLREEIENKRGLAQFVSRSGKELMDRAIASGDALGACGDPLMEAHNLIVGNVMNLLRQNGVDPLMLLAPTVDDPEGDVCPLCLVSDCKDPDCKSGCRARSTEWIEFAGRDIAERWAERLAQVTQ